MDDYVNSWLELKGKLVAVTMNDNATIVAGTVTDVRLDADGGLNMIEINNDTVLNGCNVIRIKINN